MKNLIGTCECTKVFWLTFFLLTAKRSNNLRSCVGDLKDKYSNQKYLKEFQSFFSRRCRHQKQHHYHDLRSFLTSLSFSFDYFSKENRRRKMRNLSFLVCLLLDSLKLWCSFGNSHASLFVNESRRFTSFIRLLNKARNLRGKIFWGSKLLFFVEIIALTRWTECIWS